MTLTHIVQVAGVHDAAEARLLLRCGVHWLGFPLRLPVHREDLTEEAAAEVIAGLPPEAMPVLITYLERAVDVGALARRIGARAVQLHGPFESAELRRLRRAAPDLLLVKSLVVTPDNQGELEADVVRFAADVDAFITDTFDPATGASGATGLAHDWRRSAVLAALSPRPLFLAGGLCPGNVRRAIAAVRPAGVDCHTGVEGPDGRKDEARVRAFVAEALAGFAAMVAP